MQRKFLTADLAPIARCYTVNPGIFASYGASSSRCDEKPIDRKNTREIPKRRRCSVYSERSCLQWKFPRERAKKSVKIRGDDVYLREFEVRARIYTVRAYKSAWDVWGTSAYFGSRAGDDGSRFKVSRRVSALVREFNARVRASCVFGNGCDAHFCVFYK